MVVPLLQTKLFIPPARPELVPRSRLIERLNAGMHRKLTFISAPAGSAKPTLVSVWAHFSGEPQMNTEKKGREISLRNTFDQDALLYDKARPGYPDALFKDIITFSNIPKGGSILEIGCGTAQATLPFARRGYSVHCIELGASLAAVAQRNLAPYPRAQVSVGNFEEYPLQETSFDLVISATAFHWIDPDVGYRKVAQVLRPEGAIALFWNKPVQTQLSGDFPQAVQRIYERVVPEMAKRFPGLVHPDLVPTPVKDEIGRSGLFGDVTVLKYDWNAEYTSKAYTELLSTYSDHLDLPDQVRTRLYDGIERLIETEFGGCIIKEYLSILYLAHRAHKPPNLT